MDTKLVAHILRKIKFSCDDSALLLAKTFLTTVPSPFISFYPPFISCNISCDSYLLQFSGWDLLNVLLVLLQLQRLHHKIQTSYLLDGHGQEQLERTSAAIIQETNFHSSGFLQQVFLLNNSIFLLAPASYRNPFTCCGHHIFIFSSVKVFLSFLSFTLFSGKLTDLFLTVLAQ